MSSVKMEGGGGCIGIFFGYFNRTLMLIKKRLLRFDDL